MKNSGHAFGAALATAALLFNNLAVATARAEEAEDRCVGVNACKGQSACQTAKNECKGQNACKSQGYKELTKAACEAAKAAANNS